LRGTPQRASRRIAIAASRQRRIRRHGTKGRTPMMPSSSLREKILAEAAATKSRTRSEGRRRAVLIYTVAALVGMPLFFYWGGFGHTAGRPVPLTAGLSVGALLLALASASVAWWRGKSQVG